MLQNQGVPSRGGSTGSSSTEEVKGNLPIMQRQSSESVVGRGGGQIVVPVREPRGNVRPAQSAAQIGTNPQQQESTNWVYVNGLGERDKTNVSDTDILTAIKFDKTGQYLAVGDKGGRVIIFRYTDLKNSRYFDYRYFSEIQSHEPEFDHLKSLELDEKINALEFLTHPNQSSVHMLSTNDRIVKLWKL